MKRIAVLVADGFDEIEMKSPRNYLEKRGYDVDIVSPKNVEFVRSWNYYDWGPSYPIDVHLAHINPLNYEALILPGGILHQNTLRADDKANAFMRHFMGKRKLIVVICHVALPLIELDYIRFKNITSAINIRTDLINAGANWMDEVVVIDGLLVSSESEYDLEYSNEAANSILEN